MFASGSGTGRPPDTSRRHTCTLQCRGKTRAAPGEGHADECPRFVGALELSCVLVAGGHTGNHGGTPAPRGTGGTSTPLR